MARLSEEETEKLFKAYKDAGDMDARSRLIESYLYIAEIVARKFSNRGVEYEDLYQVASIALVKAIDRFDTSRNIKFPSFATPSMIGEIKNYFRDKTRLIHISRRDSEQLLRMQEARNTLAQSGGSVHPEDIAREMDVDVERVLELLEIQQAASVISMDNHASEDEETAISNFIGQEDNGFAEVENADFIAHALERLSEKERKIVYERFWNRRSQKQVADMLQVSQMYISRSEKKILEKLRRFYGE